MLATTYRKDDLVKLSPEGRNCRVSNMFDWTGRVVHSTDEWVGVKWDGSPGPCPVCERGPAKEIWSERPEHLEFVEI